MRAREQQKSLFLDMFGDTPFLRVVEFFLTYPDFDYTKSYVAKETGVSRITIEKIWKHLAKIGLIVKSRKLGKRIMWKLNKDSPKVRILMQTITKLSLGQLEQEKVLLET
jgi:predicted transcriptional regulator